MKDKHISLDINSQLANDAKASIGQILMIERINQKLSQQDVAEQLYLKISVIDSLEDDAPIAGLPLTYLRGYQRAYTRLLGLDEAQVMGKNQTISNDVSTKEKLPDYDNQTNSVGSQWGILLVLIVLVGVIALIIALWPWLQTQVSASSLLSQADEIQLTMIAQSGMIDNSYFSETIRMCF